MWLPCLTWPSWRRSEVFPSKTTMALLKQQMKHSKTLRPDSETPKDYQTRHSDLAEDLKSLTMCQHINSPDLQQGHHRIWKMVEKHPRLAEDFRHIKQPSQTLWEHSGHALIVPWREDRQSRLLNLSCSPTLEGTASSPLLPVAGVRAISTEVPKGPTQHCPGNG